MALDAEVAADRGDDRADAVEGIERTGAQVGRSAIEETDLVEAEDEAFGSLAERDGVVLEFGGKIGFQLAEDDIGGRLGPGGMGEGRGSGAGNDDRSRALAGADTEILEAGGDGIGEAGHLGLVDFGGGVEDDEEGEEQGHEVGIGKDPAFVIAVRLWGVFS